jgi:acylphosphatase
MREMRLVISGRVQMVGFRFFSLDAARRYRVTGYVKNRADHTVEVLAQGDRENLDHFINLLRTGPPAARVDHVEILYNRQAESSFDSFFIEH